MCSSEAPVKATPRNAELARKPVGLLRLIWQASTVDWISVGILLIVAPSLDSEIARRWVVTVAILVYAYAAVGNALVTRARHVGWVLMSVVVALAIVGL